MRQAFAAQLSELERRILSSYENAANTLATISAAVGDPTPARIGTIEDAARSMRSGANSVHSDLVVVAARQSPVAEDLRLVMAMIELSHHGVLIANQFTLIAEQLTQIDPAVLDPENGAEALSQMSALGSTLLRKASTAFHTRDLASARELDSDDDAIDKLNRAIFENAAHAQRPEAQRELSLHHMLIARCLERIGDNAVDIAEQAAFLLTADLVEFTDASRPRAPRT